MGKPGAGPSGSAASGTAGHSVVIEAVTIGQVINRAEQATQAPSKAGGAAAVNTISPVCFT